MSRRLALQEAEAEASSVVGTCCVTALPVCVLGIAVGEDIVVQPKQSDEPGVSGVFMRVGNAFGIQYSVHINNDGFRRFTVAHELGHYFLPGHIETLLPDGQSRHMSRSGFVSDDRFERQADFFAAALLMPEGLFTAALLNAGEGFEAVKTLAETCRTSITATAIRYARFAEDPVAVVVSSGNKVGFCALSQALRDVKGVRPLAKGSLMPPRSTTVKFNRDEANVAGCREEGGWSSLDDWFDDAPEVEMKEDVVGLGHYGKTLTVLFTAEAIGSDEDDEGEDEE